ncbi:hypothetical protein [Jannaschia sp. W003]|uniref:hypothetical protein n=1 Tax=Jannaschia sp. W003 TaxID=2867012 RepID=UPI0021A5242D|nr:hypothetical protein [Jannaschia sp. W003]UWQ20417.1 hypothetical protein K3554_10465 [Jannaschia sp. W003]
MLIAAVVGSEAAAACAAILDLGGGPAIASAVSLPEGIMLAYAIWMTNVALALLSGVRNRMMMMLAGGLAIVGAALGSEAGWSILTVGVTLLVIAAPFALVRGTGSVARAAGPLSHSRFEGAAPRRNGMA